MRRVATHGKDNRIKDAGDAADYLHTRCTEAVGLRIRLKPIGIEKDVDSKLERHVVLCDMIRLVGFVPDDTRGRDHTLLRRHPHLALPPLHIRRRRLVAQQGQRLVQREPRLRLAPQPAH